MGSSSGVGWASPWALLAAQHPGPTITATEGLGQLGLVGEQGCRAQASRAWRPEPLLVFVVFLILLFVLIPQVFL